MARTHTPHPQRTLIIASRGSKLALQQAETVRDLLAGAGVPAEIKVITTTGDKVLDRPLHEIGGKGLFIKELEQALLAHKADLAVHSLKDLPAVVKSPFALATFLPRASAEDVLVLANSAAKGLGLSTTRPLTASDMVGLGALRIGTGSLRRHALFAAASSTLELVAVRGNVDTRLSKVKAGLFHGVILAKAALQRLGVEKEVLRLAPQDDGLSLFTLDPRWCVPCGGQGALVIETLESFPYQQWLDQAFGCADTSQCVAIERGVLAALGGDCTLPIGVHAQVVSGAEDPRTILVRGVMADLAGREARQEFTCGLELSADIGPVVTRLASLLRRNGGNEILAALGKGEGESSL